MQTFLQLWICNGHRMILPEQCRGGNRVHPEVPGFGGNWMSIAATEHHVHQRRLALVRQPVHNPPLRHLSRVVAHRVLPRSKGQDQDIAEILHTRSPKQLPRQN
jgi:hypothetical protein